MAMNAALTRFLPEQLDRLRLGLSAEPVALATIPPDFARDWLLPDEGRAPGAGEPEGRLPLARGIADIRRAGAVGRAEDAGGSAVTIQATSDTITGSFESAALYTVIAITVLLGLLLRRVVDVLLVLMPLLLSALLTLLVVVWLPLHLNFANIIALPLLLGVGVSFNIYFVMNWRAGADHPLGSATARAVLFSALTTGTAFGSLWLSAHPGTASIGGAAADQSGLHAAGDTRFHSGDIGGAAHAGGRGETQRFSGRIVPDPRTTAHLRGASRKEFS